MLCQVFTKLGFLRLCVEHLLDLVLPLGVLLLVQGVPLVPDHLVLIELALQLCLPLSVVLKSSQSFHVYKLQVDELFGHLCKT